MQTWILITIAVICLGLPLILAAVKIVKILTSDKITFIKGDKKLTVSTGHLTSEEKKQLLDF
jgi:hypothetical protein